MVKEATSIKLQAPPSSYESALNYIILNELELKVNTSKENNNQLKILWSLAFSSLSTLLKAFI